MIEFVASSLLSQALVEGAASLRALEEQNRKAISGRILVRSPGVEIEITSASGYVTSRIVAWPTLDAAVDPSGVMRDAVYDTHRKAVGS